GNGPEEGERRRPSRWKCVSIDAEADHRKNNGERLPDQRERDSPYAEPTKDDVGDCTIAAALLILILIVILIVIDVVIGVRIRVGIDVVIDVVVDVVIGIAVMIA